MCTGEYEPRVGEVLRRHVRRVYALFTPYYHQINAFLRRAGRRKDGTSSRRSHLLIELRQASVDVQEQAIYRRCSHRPGRCDPDSCTHLRFLTPCSRTDDAPGFRRFCYGCARICKTSLRLPPYTSGTCLDRRVSRKRPSRERDVRKGGQASSRGRSAWPKIPGEMSSA